MIKVKNIVAFDCGNSSVRVVAGRFDGEKVEMEVLHQVENREIEVDGVFYWDILYLFKELQTGLKKAYEKYGEIHSAGIATWGIDYALLGDKNTILSNPLCYRNPFGEEALGKLSADERRALFYESKIQCDRINSLYQFVSYRERQRDVVSAAKKLLLIPDLLIYLFTGNFGTEASITSTTQFFDTEKNRYSDDILKRFNIEQSLLMPLVEHGAVRGILSDSLSKKLNINRFPFICVPSHDTATAVAAVPTQEEDFLFISSGTWSLIGTELKKPFADDKVYTGGYANESGAFGTITLLKNSAGMFLAHRLKQELGEEIVRLSWSRIAEEAAGSDCETVINPNSPQLFNPENMANAICEEAERTGQKRPQNNAALFKTVYKSLANSYKETIFDIEKLTGKKYKKIHIIGGGSKNVFLNDLTAQLTGKTVVAGPDEATSLGNVLSQLKYFDSGLTLSDLRRISAKSCSISEHGG